MAFAAVQSFTNAGGTTQVVVNPPSGLAVGDLMLAYVSAVSKVGDPNVNIITPTGWTLVGSSIVSAQEGYALFFKIATSADVSAANFTFVTNGDEAGTILYRITGHNPAAPITVSNQGTHSGTTASATAITINLPSLVLILAGFTDNTNGGSPPSFSGFAFASNNPSWTIDLAGSGGSGVSGHAFVSGAHALYGGAINSSTGTVSATLGSTRNNNLFVVNIQPATFVSDFFGATFGTFAPTVPWLVTALAIGTFGVFQPTASEITNKWLNLKKSVDSWVNAIKH